MNKEFVDLLIKHMMRSVNDRYAIFKKLGFDDRIMGLLVLEGSAWTVATNVVSMVQNHYGEVKTQAFCDDLKKFDLPEWMNTN